MTEPPVLRQSNPQKVGGGWMTQAWGGTKKTVVGIPRSDFGNRDVINAIKGRLEVPDWVQAASDAASGPACNTFER